MARRRVREGGRINYTNAIEAFDPPGFTLHNAAEGDSTELELSSVHQYRVGIEGRLQGGESSRNPH